MSKRIHPSRQGEGMRGRSNQAFKTAVSEAGEGLEKSTGFRVEDVVQAHTIGNRWGDYVTKKRNQYLKKDSSVLNGKTARRKHSMAESAQGLQVDENLLREEFLYKPLNKANGIGPSTQDTQQNMRKQNRKLIEHFVMLTTQPHETAEVDLDLVSSLIEKGADINCSDKYGQTVLHEAARLWHTDVARFLIEKGATVQTSDKYGRTPLHLAAATDYPEMIELLCEKGADIEAKTSGEEQTPLHFAARNDAVDACKILVVKFKANVEAEDYRKRTPVSVAAELDRSETARWLMENGANVGRCDITGQSCMTNMITKMGPVARDALDTFHKTDRPNRKQYFHLNLLETDISDEKDPGIKEGTYAKTPLQVIVSFKQLDIIMHPVILKMLEVKWLHFGRIGAIKLLLINLLYILIWTVLGVGVEWQTRYSYVLPGADVWRIIFWIFAMSSTLYFIGIEVKEIRTSRERFEMWKKWREDNIEKDKKFCHPKWPEEKNYLEREMDNLDEMLPAYFHDFWNFFDWTVYFLNFLVFVTHLINVLAYTSADRPAPCCATAGCEYTADLIRQGNLTDKSACGLEGARVNNASLSVWVNRLFAINIMMMWLRLMKNIRAFRTLGPFVVMLGKITYDILRFLFLYFEFYIPYACAFWMIFGGEPTIVSMSTVDQMLFSLYRITLVDDYEYDQMHTFDVVMTYFLVGTFLGISAILCINLFIALLSDTFQRVYDNANANAVMQQAILILSIEDNLSTKRRDRFRRHIIEKCSPTEEYYDDDLTTAQGDDLKKATIQVRDQMEEVLEHIRSEKQQKEDLEKYMQQDYTNNDHSHGIRRRQSEREDDNIYGRHGSNAAFMQKASSMPASYAKIAADVSSVVTTLNKYQKGNDTIMKKMQRDLRDIKRLLMQMIPSADIRLDGRQQSFSREIRELPAITDYQQSRPQTRDDTRLSTIEQLMRESSAGREDLLGRMRFVPEEEQQRPLSQRLDPTNIEMATLPSTSILPSSGLQNESSVVQAGLPSTQFLSLEIHDSEVGSSNV